jgi:CrcB protein
MVHVLAVASGGAAGAVGRYALSYLVNQATGAVFPWGTLAVNLLGSFLLGFLTGLAVESFVSPRMRALFGVGFLGSFTTFSTFALESLNLMRRGEWMAALGNMVVTNIAGVIAAF